MQGQGPQPWGLVAAHACLAQAVAAVAAATSRSERPQAAAAAVRLTREQAHAKGSGMGHRALAPALWGQGWRRMAKELEEQYGRPWMSSPEKLLEKLKRKGNNQTVMDSTKRIHYGVDNDEIYLLVVVVDAETRRFCRKSSPKSSPET